MKTKSAFHSVMTEGKLDIKKLLGEEPDNAQFTKELKAQQDRASRKVQQSLSSVPAFTPAKDIKPKVGDEVEADPADPTPADGGVTVRKESIDGADLAALHGKKKMEEGQADYILKKHIGGEKKKSLSAKEASDFKDSLKSFMQTKKMPVGLGKK